MKEKIEKINTLYEAFEKDSQMQVEKGNKAAGKRARKNALEMIKELKEFRKLSLEASKQAE